MTVDGRAQLAQAGIPSVKAVGSPKAICRAYFENPVTPQRTELPFSAAEVCQSWLLHHWKQQGRGMGRSVALEPAFPNTSVAPLCR